jgi:hypothetical protein
MFSKWFISEQLAKIQRFIFGYPVSMIVIFILSWIGNLLNIKYLEAAILIFAALGIYSLIVKDRQEIDNVADNSLVASIFLYIICLIITFRLFILPASPPMFGYLGLYYQDSLWTIGNTWAYIRGFPLEDAKFAGVLFGYHMLQNIYQATVFKFTQIDPFYIHFYIEPIFDWFIRIFLVFYGGIKILKLPFRQMVIFWITFFFITSFLPSVSFQHNLFTNPLSFSFGLPVFILFIFYMISYLHKQKKLDIIYLTALFIYFTATKAILGIIVLIVLIILFSLKLFEKKFSIRDLLLIFSLLLSAVLLKFTIFQNTLYQLYVPYDPTISKAYQIFKKLYFIKDYLNSVYPFYRFFSTLFRLLPKYILNFPVLLFSILLFTDHKFRKKVKENINFLKFIFIYFLISLIMGTIFVTRVGAVYYIYYAHIVFAILGVFVLEYISDVKNLYYKIVTVCLLLFSLKIQVGELVKGARIGWSNLPSVKERVWDVRATIDYGEWMAMQWLKRNTKPKEIFFSDRRYFTHETVKIDVARFYGYSALSGRQAFAEGADDPSPGEFKDIVVKRWDLVNKFLNSTNPSEQEKLLKNIKAGYFIQSMRFNKKDFSKINNLELIYENSSIKVFKILR